MSKWRSLPLFGGIQAAFCIDRSFTGSYLRQKYFAHLSDEMSFCESGNRFLLITFLSLIVTTCGCAHWRKEKESIGGRELKFPKARLSADSVGLEFGLAQLDNSQSMMFEHVWEQLDEQEVDLDVRKLLDQNGIRVAIMPSHAPAQFNKLVAPRPLEHEQLTLVERKLAEKGKLKPKSRMVEHQRISNRDGQSHPIQTSDVHPELSWVIHNNDRQSFGSGKSVRGMFKVTTTPQGDGTVRLRFSPQIYHGDPRPTYDVAGNAFFVESSQAVTKLAHLEFAVTVRPGESVVVAPTADLTDLGKLFFGMADRNFAPPNEIVSVPDESKSDIELLIESLPDHPDDDIDNTNETFDLLNLDAPWEDPGKTETVTSNLTHRILMVRVVQTQMDDLFGNSAISERLSTTPRD